MLDQKAHEFVLRVQKIRVRGIQGYAGMLGSSSSSTEQLLNLRSSCAKLLKFIADNKPKSEFEVVLGEIDGQVRLAISTGLIGGDDTDELLKLVDNLYEAMENNK